MLFSLYLFSLVLRRRVTIQLFKLLNVGPEMVQSFKKSQYFNKKNADFIISLMVIFKRVR